MVDEGVVVWAPDDLKEVPAHEAWRVQLRKMALGAAFLLVGRVLPVVSVLPGVRLLIEGVRLNRSKEESVDQEGPTPIKGGDRSSV